MKFALLPSTSRLASSARSLPSVSVRRNGGGGWWFCNRCQQIQAPRPSPGQVLLSSKRQYHGTYSLRNSKTSRHGADDVSEALDAVKRKTSRRRAIRLAAAGGTVAVTVFAFWDDIKHTYVAAARTGRVVTTLAICINEYDLSIDFLDRGVRVIPC